MSDYSFLAGSYAPFVLPDGNTIHLLPLMFGDLRRASDMPELDRVGFIASRVICSTQGSRLFETGEAALDGVTPAILTVIVREAVRRTEVADISPLP